MIREANLSDHQQIYTLLESCFPTAAEAKLTKKFLQSDVQLICWVATSKEQVTGMILYTPVTLENQNMRFVGLAPMAVDPKFQNQGIGKALVEKSLQQCKAENVSAVVVLGHPEYYPKFGFRPSTEFQLKSEYDVPSDVFMVLELDQGCLNECCGIIKYHEFFNGL